MSEKRERRPQAESLDRAGPKGLSSLERRIIHDLQRDLPVVSRPFAVVAARLGISEKELIARVKAFMAEGTIRRFGATLRHQHSGFEANAMVIWQVSAERVGEIGSLFAAFREVTHCYERTPAPGWPYRLFTMIHGRTREECREIVRRMAAASGLQRYQLLFTVEELKKTTMAYFAEGR